jgi:eukaryotic-like serine/threonine-protein kinase
MTSRRPVASRSTNDQKSSEIRAECASFASLARFEAERQALALMDHPNIAKVLDAGTTDSGRPFFVMELVKGVPITQFCDERQLSPRQRLELFIPVCQAIQHAHQKGIIHRDIKPTNVLVALYDDRPVPKVIDFGVAKATGQQLTDASLMTGFGGIVGTPEYMSPEQAQLNQLDIDTRSDVYALGVLLYELLTGTTPIDRKRLGQGALFEVLRIIREEEPPRPSARLSTSDALASIAATRKTEPARLTKLMRGELDWIVMKCLEKDRSRRYETANGLAHDIERYLQDEVVEAQPPTAGYRLRKFVRKHRRPVLAAAVVGMVLLLGIMGTTWGYYRAERNAGLERLAKEEANRQRIASDEAQQEALHAERKALDAKTEADRQRAEADKQRDDARVTAYASGMQLAQRAWEENNVVRARELLEEVPKEAAGRKLRGFEWRYLSRLCHSEALTLNGHTATVMSVAFSPDGQRVASGSFDGTARIWDSATGKELLTLDAGQVQSLAFSPDGQRLATGSGTGIRIWDSRTGKQLISPEEGAVTSVAFSPDGQRLASGIDTATVGMVKIWDSATGKELLGFDASAPVSSVAFSPDGRRLASGSLDKTVKVWDSSTGKELFSLKGHAGQVSSVAFSPDGQRLASAGGDAMIWDTASGKRLLDLQHGGFESVTFSSDGTRLATGGNDKTVKIWDSATGKELFDLKGHGHNVMSVAFSPDGQRLASGSGDNTVKIWDSATSNQLFSLKGPTGEFTYPATSVAFSPDSQRLSSETAHGTVRILDSATGKELFSLKREAGRVKGVLSPDGQRVASWSHDGVVKIWDSATGKELLSLKGLDAGVTSMAFSPDCRLLASGSEDATVKIRDSATGKELFSLKGHAGPVMSAAFSPDGRRLASGDRETVKLWDSATGKELFSLKSHVDREVSVAFSPDGGRLASGRRDKTVQIWDTASGTKLLEVQHGALTCVTFSPDGKRLASFSVDDRNVKIWEIATGNELLALKGHASGVQSVAFSPDGQRLASSAMFEDTVKIWDTETGKELFSFEGHAPIAFSPDGQRLASGGTDGSIHLWETMNVSPEIRQDRATSQRVADLFGRTPMRADVLERLRVLPGMIPSQRQEAITVARTYPEDPAALNELAWPLVKLPAGEMSGYRQALRFSEEACQLEPMNGDSLNTLGVAYYRVGNYEKALATLLRSDQINKARFEGSIPADLAILAMTQQQLGHAKEAQAELQRLRERMKDPRWAKDDEAKGFLREAEALLANPKTPGGK